MEKNQDFIFFNIRFLLDCGCIDLKTIYFYKTI